MYFIILQIFWKNTAKFVRAVSDPLRTILRIKVDSYGNKMIYPLQGKMGIKVYLELDNRKCEDGFDKECFLTAAKAAEFLAAIHTKHELNTGFPIQSIEGFARQTIGPPEGEAEGVESETNMVYIVVAVFAIVMAAVIMGVLVNAQRKRARGITWFPEDFFKSYSGTRRRQSKRRGPDGQEMRNLHKQPSSNHVNLDANDNATMHHGAQGMMGMPHYGMDDTDVCPPKRMKVRMSSNN